MVWKAFSRPTPSRRPAWTVTQFAFSWKRRGGPGGPWCDGRSHDGCKHGCRIFWKEAWLRPVDVATAEFQLGSRRSACSPEGKIGRATLLLPIDRAIQGDGGLPCPAAAQGSNITEGNSDWRCEGVQALRLLGLWSWQQFLCVAGCDNWLRGPHKRTPTQSLNLQAGELVRVKTRAQISETLNRWLSNRGLAICYEMKRCSGARQRFAIVLIDLSTRRPARCGKFPIR